jgi:hypothetical protein
MASSSQLAAAAGEASSITTIWRMRSGAAAVQAEEMKTKINVARHTADDLFGGLEGSPRTDKMVAAAIQWADRILRKIAVVLLISMDLVSGQHTTDSRRRKAVDDRILNRFLHRRRPKPKL